MLKYQSKIFPIWLHVDGIMKKLSSPLSLQIPLYNKINKLSTGLTLMNR